MMATPAIQPSSPYAIVSGTAATKTEISMTVLTTAIGLVVPRARKKACQLKAT
jgi:hypothetical protein